MMSSSTAASDNGAMEESVNGHGSGGERRKSRSRAALYSDELRIKIIEEVYQQRLLWDPENREANTLTASERKKAFCEIAARLHSPNGILTAENVEKQWKNLKDTYVKVRKKLPGTEQGDPTPPRWRFYRLLQFIDQDPATARGFDLRREVQNFRQEVQQQNLKSQPQSVSISSSSNNKPSSSSTSFSSSSNTSTSFSSQSSMSAPNHTLVEGVIAVLPESATTPSSIPPHRQNGRQNSVKHVANTIAMLPNNSTSIGMLPNPLPATLMHGQMPRQSQQQQQFINAGLKRAHDGQLINVRHDALIPIHQQNGQLKMDPMADNGNPGPAHKSKPQMNGQLLNGVSHMEDEYVIFCNSLIHPLREIGQHNKLEYLKFKKIIHDALYDVQSRIHSSPSTEPPTKILR